MIDCKQLLQPTATIVAALIHTTPDRAENLTETFVKTYKELQAALNQIESQDPPRVATVNTLRV